MNGMRLEEDVGRPVHTTNYNAISLAVHLVFDHGSRKARLTVACPCVFALNFGSWQMGIGGQPFGAGVSGLRTMQGQERLRNWFIPSSTHQAYQTKHSWRNKLYS